MIEGADRMVLEGEHVRLEPLSLNHVSALVEAADESRETYAWTWVPDGKEGTAAYTLELIEQRRRGHVVPFATVRKADNRVVGATRFMAITRYDWPERSPFRRELDSVEIGGTWLAASAQRSAVNTEAKYLMLRHAFEEWGVHRVELLTDERNERSRRAIERIGARLDGVLRNHRMGADLNLRSSAVYSVIETEWPAVKAGLEQKLRR